MKRKHQLAFKKEVIEYMSSGRSAYNASKYFGLRNKEEYDPSMFRQWFKKKEVILASGASKSRVEGGGRKPLLGDIEELLANEIIELRLLKVKVTRQFISDRARMLANGDGFKASPTFVTNFMKRFGFSLRRMTNLTVLSDEQLLLRAVSYMKYLKDRMPYLNLQKTLLMDETAIYFEDSRTQTVDYKGAKHVILKSTGYASMRITACVSVWADGRKAPPLIIHKGKNNVLIQRISGPLLHVTQEKAWVNQDLIISWVDSMFPIVDISPGKCIVWDSCRVHVGKRVKEHCRRRNIELIVIPGGLTPYLQAGDIGIYREFKDKLSSLINYWKNSEQIEYTKGGNPKPPSSKVIQSWVRDAWQSTSISNIKKSILSAGFNEDFEQWHISKHDVYGERFIQLWKDNAGSLEVNTDFLEEIDQDDDIQILL